MTDIAKDNAAKKAKTAVESATETVTAPFESMINAFKDAQGKFEIPEAAREFVKRAAETGKERAAKAQADANKVTASVESAFTQSIEDAAALSRHVIKVAHEDAAAALSAVEKLAGAKSLNEAIQVQVDYARERAEVGAARLKDGAEFLVKTLSDRAKSIQSNWAANSPFASKAA